MKTFLSQLQNRHATKIFDSQKTVEKEKIEAILDAIVLSPSSLGLQPYKVIIVTDKNKKESLQKQSYNQPQISTASHVLVFARNINIDECIQDYARNAKKAVIPQKELDPFLEMIQKAKTKCTPEWADQQVFLALGFAMAACAELQVDSCAIGGFDSTKYDEILNLPPHLQSSVVLPLGYRVSDPHRPKVRKNQEQLFDWL